MLPRRAGDLWRRLSRPALHKVPELTLFYRWRAGKSARTMGPVPPHGPRRGTLSAPRTGDAEYRADRRRAWPRGRRSGRVQPAISRRRPPEGSERPAPGRRDTLHAARSSIARIRHVRLSGRGRLEPRTGRLVTRDVRCALGDEVRLDLLELIDRGAPVGTVGHVALDAPTHEGELRPGVAVRTSYAGCPTSRTSRGRARCTSSATAAPAMARLPTFPPTSAITGARGVEHPEIGRISPRRRAAPGR